MADTVRVRVPATTANLGPGFDTLGIALRIYNTVAVRRASEDQPDEMAAEAARVFFETSGRDAFPFAWRIRGAVPRSRGLGSSVTVRLGLLHGLNALAGSPLPSETLYRLCANLEGHPDNAAPAAFGGFTVVRRNAAFQRFSVASRLRFVLLVPGFELPTSEARKALPGTIPLQDAVISASNSASIAAAFASRNYDALPGCFEDRLHQPYRKPLIPCLDRVIAAGVQAGALGGWLSGSGSTIACATLRDPQTVAAAMMSACGLDDAITLVTTAENRGVRVTIG